MNQKMELNQVNQKIDLFRVDRRMSQHDESDTRQQYVEGYIVVMIICARDCVFMTCQFRNARVYTTYVTYALWYYVHIQYTVVATTAIG